MTCLTPREIVSELDRFIIGQNNAKRAVAIALRNRWRRKQLDPELQDEILPKNILMIGPTGCGKTEISRRIAKLALAPFLKVEATKFTEVGYIGRDVDQIIRDLVEVSINLTREQKRKQVAPQAQLAAEERVLTALVGSRASKETRESFRKKLLNGELNDKEIEIVIDKSPSFPMFDLPSAPGAQMGMINVSEMLGNALGNQKSKRRMRVEDSYEVLMNEECDRQLDGEQIAQEAIRLVEEEGIVFIDEIDKICTRNEKSGADVSREGVQRDLLPLLEGSTVATKHGPVKTGHILFITSGAFHVAKPTDLLPELQGRLPIRVELEPLTRQDFYKILTETEANLIQQSEALIQTEGVNMKFAIEAVGAIADAAFEVNAKQENIGARRLHTIVEHVLMDISFSAPDQTSHDLSIDADYVKEHLRKVINDGDASEYIL